MTGTVRISKRVAWGVLLVVLAIGLFFIWHGGSSSDLWLGTLALALAAVGVYALFKTVDPRDREEAD